MKTEFMQKIVTLNDKVIDLENSNKILQKNYVKVVEDK